MQEQEKEKSANDVAAKESVGAGFKPGEVTQFFDKKATAEKKPGWKERTKNWYKKIKHGRLGFVVETTEEYLKNAFAGVVLGGIALFLEYISKKGFLNVLYLQFGKDFLHHYVGFPVGLLYVLLIFAAAIMWANREAAKVFRIGLVDPITHFVFHMSSIAAGSLFISKLFDHIPEGLMMEPWHQIAFLTLVSISVPTMVEYAYKTPEDIDKAANAPTGTPDEAEKLKARTVWLKWGVLLTAVIAGGFGGWCLLFAS